MDKQPKNKQQAILLAAEQEFIEHGYDGAKTVSIARRAGVTHAMLHYYFGTKMRLFEQVLNTKVRVIAADIVRAFTSQDGNEPLIDRIIKGQQAHFDGLAANPGLPLFVLNEVSRNDQLLAMFAERVQSLGAELIGGLQSEIDREVSRGTFKPIKAADLLLDIVSLNLFPLLAQPVLRKVSHIIYGIDYDQLLASRRQEIGTVIRARILVNP